jgi:phosphopantothenoylcysteine decarboxylase / phosphopantothenate---cysteine ligase
VGPRAAEVVLVSGPSHLPPPVGARVVRVETAAEMATAVGEHLPDAEVLVMAAAVADFRPAAPAGEKIKKEEGGLERIETERTADILATTREARRSGALVVGFALETGDAVAKGSRKLAEKGLDLLVVNDATEPGAGFEVETNRCTLLAADGTEEPLPLLSKRAVAERILDRISDGLSTHRAG